MIADPAGQPVTVTGPSEINLNQSGLRLAPAQTVVQEPEGATEHEDGEGSSPAAPPDGQSAEKSVSFTVLSPATDPDRAAAIAALLLALYEAVDAQKSSYFQGTIKVVVDANVVPKLVERAEALGIQITIQDQ